MMIPTSILDGLRRLRRRAPTDGIAPPRRALLAAALVSALLGAAHQGLRPATAAVLALPVRPPAGDLAVTGAGPVQALPDQGALVRDRATAARVDLTSTFSTSVAVPIWVSLSYCGSGVCTPGPVLPAGASPPTVVVAPGSHSYYVGPPATASTGIAGAEACVNVQVDYGNTLPETNESNNALATCRPLVTTMQLRVFFVPVALGSFPPPSCSSVQAVASRSIDFVRGTYPVADAGPRAAAAYVSCRPLAYQVDGQALLGLQSDWRDDGGQPAPPTAVPHHDAIVGVFAQYASAGLGLGQYGNPDAGVVYHASIVEDTQLDGSAAAQEMAHNFGWVTRDFPLNDGTGHLQRTPAPGYWVGKGCAMGFYRWSMLPAGVPCDPTGNPIDFMYYLGNNHPNDVTTWVSRYTWDFLLRSLTTSDPVLPPNGTA
jgi:hypothetical protein